MELFYIFIFWALRVHIRGRKQTAQDLEDIWDQRDIRLAIVEKKHEGEEDRSTSPLGLPN